MLEGNMKVVEAPKDVKKGHIERLLSLGMVMVFIDTRISGVLVPEPFRNNPQLPLNFDYAFGIPDFKIKEEHIEATLEFFHTTQFFCMIPMDAIYAARSEKEIVVFPESIPKELITSMPVATPKVEPEILSPSKKKPKLISLETVLEEASEPNAKLKKKRKAPAKKTTKPHLKLVK